MSRQFQSRGAGGYRIEMPLALLLDACPIVSPFSKAVYPFIRFRATPSVAQYVFIIPITESDTKLPVLVDL